MSRLSSSMHCVNPFAEVSFPTIAHKVAADYLRNESKLVKGKESLRSTADSWQKRIRLSIPLKAMLAQFCWTTMFTLIAYAVAIFRLPDDATLTQRNSFTNAFWKHGFLTLPASLAFGIGWALFLLLSFFISQASKHHHEGRAALAKLSFVLRRGARHLRQNYPKQTWHQGDHDRIIALLVAYPLAFCNRNHPGLSYLLHQNDIDDIQKSPVPYYHCMAVVRAYFTATEPDSSEFETAVQRKLEGKLSPAGKGTRNVSSLLLDEIDSTANTLRRVSTFRPAVAYVNHLTLFVYIWLAFVPLTMISSAGW